MFRAKTSRARDSITTRPFVILAATFLLFYIQTMTPCFAAELKKIDTVVTEKTNYVILKLNEAVRYKYQMLPADDSYPGRCYIDLYNTNRSNSLPSWIAIGNAHLTKLRTGIHGTTLRVVLDLKNNYACALNPTSDPTRLVMTVTEPGLIGKPESNFAQTELKQKITLPPEPPSMVNKQPEEEEEPAAKSTVETDNRIDEAEPTFDGLTIVEKNKIETWGWIQLFTAQDIDNQSAEDHKFNRGRFQLGADWESSLPSDLSLQVKGSIDIDRIFYDADAADDETEIDMHEAYLQLNGSTWDVSFGKQRVRWGKSDQLSPVDSINPQDYRQSLAVDLEERAIPSWMLRSRWYGDRVGVEGILQPWFEQSEIDYFDSDWALYRNMRQSILENPAVPAFLQNYASTLRVDEDKPSHSLENMSAGLRMTLQTEQTDFAVSYHYGWETLPTISSFPVGNINYNGDPATDAAALLATAPLPTSNRIDSTYKRKKTVGFEWETTLLDPFGFRGEIAHSDKIAYLSSDLTSQRKSTSHLVAGIDYTSASEWYFNLQGSWQYIHDFDKEILYFEKDTVALLGEIRKPIWRGNLEFATKYNYVITDQSSYLQPSVTLKYFRNVECELGAMVYSGKGDTLLGSYDQADQVYGLVKITF